MYTHLGLRVVYASILINFKIRNGISPNVAIPEIISGDMENEKSPWKERKNSNTVKLHQTQAKKNDMTITFFTKFASL